MTKHEALTSMAQTLLRSRLGYGPIHPSLRDVARAVADITEMANKNREPMFDASDENAAIIEISHRYDLHRSPETHDRQGRFIA